MPKTPAHDRNTMVRSALDHFWVHGYASSSMDDLVRATGVSRYGFYSEFSGKHDLFLAIFETYQEEVVTPAFARVEAEGAGFDELLDYYETQIALAESLGLPGRGCLVANTLAELAQHDPDARRLVRRHEDRLRAGFRNALEVEASDLPANEIDELADLLVVFTQGLWSASRGREEAAGLRRAAEQMIELVKRRTRKR